MDHVRGRNDHAWENGRRRHGHTSQFPFPDDATTTASLPFLAPIPLPLKKNTKILDVAARDGSWIYSIQGHDKYGKAQYTGLEPAWLVHGEDGWSPDWMIHEDLEGPWPFTTKQAFHLIHGEALGGLLTDWKGFYANVFKHLVPGGWVGLLEHDLRFHPREGKEEEMEGKWDVIKKWQELISEAAEKFGKRINMGSKQKALMEEAGLVEVQSRYSRFLQKDGKMTPQQARMGSFYHHHWKEQLQGYSLRLFTKTLGWSKENTDNLIERVLQELNQEDLQLYSLFYLVIGRKPRDAARS
ncbi:hypothetical protein BDV06DRAFT_233127 [Aspergillus oleicola]